MKKIIILIIYVINLMPVLATEALIPLNSGKSRSLNSNWQLCVVKGIVNSVDENAEYKEIPVPGCWESYGFCEAKCDYPDSLTGFYKTTFSVPKEWVNSHVFIRFDGVLYGYNLYINDNLVGSWESSYNTKTFDITQYIKPQETQRLAMRVYSKYKGSDFDCNDDWAPNGIFRDVTLYSVSGAYLDDLFVQTVEVSEEEYADVKIDYSIQNQSENTVFKYKILSPNGNVIGEYKDARDIRIYNPSLWTAETPHLYTIEAELQTNDATNIYCQKFGIRKITIDGNVFKLNNHPIKLRGVNCHSTDPRTMKVVGDTLTLKDMKLMKEASINCIRTSHYPREPHFYDMADSLGFYIIDEVPFGYGDNLLKDETILPILKTRAEYTVKRDRMHPSVIIWSVGNENELTPICEEVGKYVKLLDNSRPICFPQEGSYFKKINYQLPEYIDILSPHYPTVDNLSTVYQNTDRPILFTEYLHSLGQSFEDHDKEWDIIKKSPNMLGGCVWEWVDQGYEYKPDTNIEPYGYVEDVYQQTTLGIAMNGNQCTDGMLYANRIPLPNYYELQRNYSCAYVSDLALSGIDSERGVIALTIRNDYNFIDLKESHYFKWRLKNNGNVLESGTFTVDCQAGAEVNHSINLHKYHSDLDGVVYLEIDTYYGNYLINNQSFKFKLNSNVRTLVERLLRDIDTQTESPFDVLSEWPIIRIGRKQTLADKTNIYRYVVNQYLVRLNRNLAKNEQLTTEAQVTATAVNKVYKVNFSLTPEKKKIFLSELGLGMLLNKDIVRVKWIGKGPYSSYPGKRRANNYGVWSLHRDDLYFEGNRMDVEAVLLTDSKGDGILLFCNQGCFNFEQTDRGIVVTYNVAVAGIPPKWLQSSYPVWADEIGEQEGEFYIYRVNGSNTPGIIRELFGENNIEEPYKPFFTQYDTYLMKYEDIISGDAGVWTEVRYPNSADKEMLKTGKMWSINGMRFFESNLKNGKIIIKDGQKFVIKN